jgi:hypothetical protein
MINLTGHALESLANQSGFQKADTLAAKQKLVHAVRKGSMHSPCFILFQRSILIKFLNVSFYSVLVQVMVLMEF